MRRNFSLFLLFLQLSFFGHSVEFTKTEASSSVVEIINHKFNGFMINEKIELGIDLPQEIHDKVENFVQGIGSPREQLNPYLEWDVRVYGEFTNENSGEMITVEGFYYKEFDAWTAKSIPAKSSYIYTADDFRKLGGYKPKSTEKSFRIRFAAPSSGNWSSKVFLLVNGEPCLTYDKVNFTVNDIKSSDYIQVSENKRVFIKDGQFFYPRGINLSWPETDLAIDPELAKNLCGYSEYDKKVMCSNEGYMNVYVAPRTYQKYRTLMKDLADNGTNFLRTIMYPTGTEIEWEEIGNYSKRLHMAQEMDSILETAEANGLFLLWDLQTHYSFQQSDHAYYRTWAWDTKMNGYDFCYKKLIKTDNPVDFFTNAEAKRYYQQRLRYIIARWGYSPNIFGFELFCEISNVGAPKADNSDYYRTGDNYQLYRDWQVEMASYIKSYYYGKKHLLTASYGGEKVPNDDTFHNDAFDFMSSNIYDFDQPEFASYYIRTTGSYLDDRRGEQKSLNSYVLNTTHEGKEDYQIRKPMIYSEADAIGASCDSPVVELRRAIWQSAFSGLAGSFSWDFRFRKKYFSIYGEMGNLLSQFDLTKNGWHPGAMINKNGNWEYSDEYAKMMNPKVKYRKLKGKHQSATDVMFLRTEDKNFAFGVITNKTYNSKTVDTCNHSQWGSDYQVLLEARNVDLSKEGPRVPGMNKGKYEIEYFYVSNPNKAVGYSTSSGPNLSFDFTIPANDFNYIVIFKAKKVDSSWNELKSKNTSSTKIAER